MADLCMPKFRKVGRSKKLFARSAPSLTKKVAPPTGFAVCYGFAGMFCDMLSTVALSSLHSYKPNEDVYLCDVCCSLVTEDTVIMPNTHRRRHATVELRRVGGVNTIRN